MVLKLQITGKNSQIFIVNCRKLNFVKPQTREEIFTIKEESIKILKICGKEIIRSVMFKPGHISI